MENLPRCLPYAPIHIGFEHHPPLKVTSIIVSVFDTFLYNVQHSVIFPSPPKQNTHLTKQVALRQTPKKNQPTTHNQRKHLKKYPSEHVEIRRLDHFFNAVAGPTSSLPSLELLLAFASAVAEAVATAGMEGSQSMPVELQRWLKRHGFCGLYLPYLEDHPS